MRDELHTFIYRTRGSSTFHRPFLLPHWTCLEWETNKVHHSAESEAETSLWLVVLCQRNACDQLQITWLQKQTLIPLWSQTLLRLWQQITWRGWKFDFSISSDLAFENMIKRGETLLYTVFSVNHHNKFSNKNVSDWTRKITSWLVHDNVSSWGKEQWRAITHRKSELQSVLMLNSKSIKVPNVMWRVFNLWERTRPLLISWGNLVRKAAWAQPNHPHFSFSSGSALFLNFLTS